MALADWDAFIAALLSPRERVFGSKSSFISSAAAGKLMSQWTATPFAGSAPTTAAACTKATLGSFPFDTWQNSGGSFSTYCVGGHADIGDPYVAIVADRLSHQGGLSGTTTGAQTTNLPTAALTRYTSGAGVMIGIEVYSAVGASGGTITATYTNQAGTGSQVTPTIAFGGTTFREAGLVLLLPLQVGDTGVRSVESVTISASTGTAGNFGVTLFKPLMVFNATRADTPFDPVLSGQMFGGLPELVDDACLSILANPATGTSRFFTAALSFAEA